MTADQRFEGVREAIHWDIWAEGTTSKNRLGAWGTRVEAGRPVRISNPGGKSLDLPNAPKVKRGLKI